MKQEDIKVYGAVRTDKGIEVIRDHQCFHCDEIARKKCTLSQALEESVIKGSVCCKNCEYAMTKTDEIINLHGHKWKYSSYDLRDNLRDYLRTGISKGGVSHWLARQGYNLRELITLPS